MKEIMKWYRLFFFGKFWGSLPLPFERIVLCDVIVSVEFISGCIALICTFLELKYLYFLKYERAKLMFTENH